MSLTSLKGSKDQTVILHGGEHPFLKWATYVAYAQSDLINTERFRNHCVGVCKDARGFKSEMDSPDTGRLSCFGFYKEENHRSC